MDQLLAARFKLLAIAVLTFNAAGLTTTGVSQITTEPRELRVGPDLVDDMGTNRDRSWDGPRKKGSRPAASKSDKKMGPRDRATSESAWSSSRQIMQNEIKNVPLLYDKLQALGDIQQKRFALQRERVEVAENRSIHPDESLKRFHRLLKRDEELSRQLKDLASSTDGIFWQIAERQIALEALLEKIPANDETTAIADERTRLEHSLRMYDFIIGRFQAIKENPERVDLLGRFLRGFAEQDDRADRRAVRSQKKLESLQDEQRKLQARLKQVNEEMRETRKSMGRGRPVGPDKDHDRGPDRQKPVQKMDTLPETGLATTGPL